MLKNSEVSKTVVNRYLQAVVDGDAETVESLHHPDAKYWAVGRGDVFRTSPTTWSGSGSYHKGVSTTEQ